MWMETGSSAGILVRTDSVSGGWYSRSGSYTGKGRTADDRAGIGGIFVI